MKLAFLSLLLLSLTLRAEPPGIDQSSELLTVSAGDKFLRWYGHAGRSYFLQVSDANNPLAKWFWAPLIEGGNDEEISYEVDGTAAKGFFRLKYTDQVPGPGETLETADFDNDGRSNINEISPPPPLSASDATDPLDGDTDHDGLLDGFELAYGFDPNNPDEDDNNVLDGEDDSDGDGWSNSDEADAGTDPNDPDDDPNTPAEPWVSVTGDGAEGVPVTESRTFTIKKGQSRLLVLGTTSLEYPNYTGEASEWDDLLEWKITPSFGEAIDGNLNVNDRHGDWEIDEINEVTLGGFGPSPPVHIETVRVIQAPADADLTVVTKLTATNVSDGILPSSIIVGLLPLKVTSNSAQNNEEYNISKHDEALYPRPGNVLITDTPKAFENALRLNFEDCTEPEEIEVRASTHFDLIAGTGDPIKLDDLHWTVIEKPPGSPELTPTQSDHLIRVMTNNGSDLRGGLYRFKLDGVDGNVDAKPQVWLPLAGPDITAYWQSEITYFKGTWGPAYRTRIEGLTLDWVDFPTLRFIMQQKIALGEMLELGSLLDWHGAPVGEYSPCGGPNKLGDEFRLTIAKVVIDFRKRNNMMYALIGREMTIPEIVLLNAADPAKNPFATGAPDNDQTIQSYLAGFFLYNGISLEDTMTTLGRKMQNPHSWSRFEWPSWETTTEPLVRARAAQLDALIH